MCNTYQNIEQLFQWSIAYCYTLKLIGSLGLQKHKIYKWILDFARDKMTSVAVTLENAADFPKFTQKHHSFTSEVWRVSRGSLFIYMSVCTWLLQFRNSKHRCFDSISKGGKLCLYVCVCNLIYYTFGWCIAVNQRKHMIIWLSGLFSATFTMFSKTSLNDQQQQHVHIGFQYTSELWSWSFLIDVSIIIYLCVCRGCSLGDSSKQLLLVPVTFQIQTHL